MADRLVVGKANNGTSDVYGLWVSKPGVNVINGSGVLASAEDLLFDSRNPFGQVLSSGAIVVPAESNSQISFTARNGKTPPLFWWNTTNAELTNVNTSYQTKVTATFSITGNNGTLTFSNNDGAPANIGYFLLSLDE